MRSTSLPRAFVGLAAASFVLSLIAPAALAAGQDRIHGNIVNGARAEIADSVHPRARAATDLGPAAGDTKLDMSLRFGMTDAQSAALDQLLTDQQNPASSQYHQWLTPAQFADQFGLSQADIGSVTAWLAAQGFSVTSVANGRTFVTFEGTVAQAEAAFGTSIHNLSSNGEAHFANVTNVTLPAALANVVTGVTGLHDFRAHPHMRAIARPEFTSSQSGNHYLAPGDINTIYDMKPLLTSFTGAGIGTGANCKSTGTPSTCGDIAVVGEVELAGVTNASGTPTDVLAFRTAAGLSTPNNLPTTVLAVPGSDPGPPQTCINCIPNSGDLQESSLDVEWAGAMAPGANVIFVIGHDVLLNSMTVAIDNNLAPIITDSYGLCEAGWGSTELISLNLLFKQGAVQGQTVLAAAGDAGAADCDAGIPTVEGLTVDFPASSPYVLAMGGTMFNGDGEAGGSGTTWAATQYWAGTSGSDVISSALSYIPEMVWNEDTTSNSLSAGGGGVSAFFSKPTWQASGTPEDSSRDVPDLSLAAASIHDPLLFCYSASCASGFRTSSGNLTVAGGTSFDSQMFGGMLALIEQKAGSRIGLATPTLYALGNNATYYNSGTASVFHDITSGNNNDPCTAGTPNCPNGGNIGYSAATGYDLATGWGSVDLNNLATDWKLVTPLGVGSAFTAIPSSTSLVASTTSVTTGSSVTLTATITGASGTPTGTVQFLANNAALGSPVALNSSGVAIYTYNATCTTLGQQMMSAVYSGDATYAGSKGPALLTGVAGNSGGTTISNNGSVNTTPLIVTVTSSSCPDFSVAPSGSAFTISGSNASTTVAAGGTIPSVTITVAPLNGFAGTVTFSASTVSTTGFAPSVTFNPASLTFTSSSSASQSTSVSLSGITADLRLPARPGSSSTSYPWYAAGSGVAVASLFLLMFPRRRRLGGLLAVALAVGLAIGASGCGGSSSSTGGGGTTTTNPYIGTYQVTVAATYSSSGQTITHSAVVTYNIN